MKKIFLSVSLVGLLAACAPQPTPLQNLVAVCLVCMAKAQLSEAALQKCPRLLGVKHQQAYSTFNTMSKTVYKDEHRTRVAALRQTTDCGNVVTQIQNGNATYEFLRVK